MKYIENSILYNYLRTKGFLPCLNNLSVLIWFSFWEDLTIWMEHDLEFHDFIVWKNFKRNTDKVMTSGSDRYGRQWKAEHNIIMCGGIVIPYAIECDWSFADRVKK